MIGFKNSRHLLNQSDETKVNHDLVTRVFPRFASAKGNLHFWNKSPLNCWKYCLNLKLVKINW